MMIFANPGSKLRSKDCNHGSAMVEPQPSHAMEAKGEEHDAVAAVGLLRTHEVRSSLNMYELSLSMLEPMLSPSMLIWATNPLANCRSSL